MTESAAPHRYVVLHHQGVPQPHFDLMIETMPGAQLMTWRCPSWPIAQETNLTRLGEHRRDYLEFEGPLSGDRGHVRRVAKGMCDVKWLSPHELEANLGDITLLLQRLDDDHWLASPRK